MEGGCSKIWTMFRDQWFRFSWNLKDLPKYEHNITGRMRLRQSTDEDDIDVIWDVIVRAYTTDQGWGSGMTDRLEKVEKAVRNKNGEKLTFIILEDGKCIVGVSGILPAANPQLVTGVCVLEEYRCRGYGTAILYASLKHLADQGLSEASVITKTRIHALKYLYPKFGGKAEPMSKGESKEESKIQPIIDWKKEVEKAAEAETEESKVGVGEDV